MVALICLKDGNRVTAHMMNNLESGEQRDLVHFVHNLKLLSPDLTDILDGMLQVLNQVPISCWRHRPCQAQSLTAGAQVDPDFTRLFRACVKTVFDKAISKVPQR